MTGDGSIVVGSQAEVLRCYSPKSFQKAVTSFPSIGLEISHVDITFDVKLILVTTTNFLMLFSSSESGVPGIAFERKLGKKISFSTYLCLTPLDQQLARQARFFWQIR